MADFKTYLGALELSYPENPTAVAVAKEVYSMFTEQQLRSARKAAFLEAAKIADEIMGRLNPVSDELRREAEK